MLNLRSLIYFSLLITVSAACKKPYSVPVIKNSVNYLVVEGFINSGNDSTIIKLSRTVKLSDKTASNAVSGAQVSVESEQKISYALIETSAGYYSTANLNLDPLQNYRLYIKTADSLNFASDFVPVKITPEIDSIGFDIVNNPQTGVQIYVNSHDNNNNTRYYRWDYAETWRFHAKYISNYFSDGYHIIPRQPDDVNYFCFGTNKSSDIVLGSTEKLQNDIVFKSPIQFIISTSEKIELKYSILIRQYALTSEAYKFWDNIKKNSEQLGGIFDVTPSQSTGNIHCLNNPAVPVIGYISVSTTTSKRIFIEGNQLPNWQATYPYLCPLDTNLFCFGAGCVNQVALNLLSLPNQNIPVQAIGQVVAPDGYTSSSLECVDCTIRGTKIPPAFWK